MKNQMTGLQAREEYLRFKERGVKGTIEEFKRYLDEDLINYIDDCIKFSKYKENELIGMLRLLKKDFNIDIEIASEILNSIIFIPDCYLDKAIIFVSKNNKDLSTEDILKGLVIGCDLYENINRESMLYRSDRVLNNMYTYDYCILNGDDILDIHKEIVPIPLEIPKVILLPEATEPKVDPVKPAEVTNPEQQFEMVVDTTVTTIDAPVEILEAYDKEVANKQPKQPLEIPEVVEAIIVEGDPTVENYINGSLNHIKDIVSGNAHEELEALVDEIRKFSLHENFNKIFDIDDKNADNFAKLLKSIPKMVPNTLTKSLLDFVKRITTKDVETIIRLLQHDFFRSEIEDVLSIVFPSVYDKLVEKRVFTKRRDTLKIEHMFKMKDIYDDVEETRINDAIIHYSIKDGDKQYYLLVDEGGIINNKTKFTFLPDEKIIAAEAFNLIELNDMAVNWLRDVIMDGKDISTCDTLRVAPNARLNQYVNIKSLESIGEDFELRNLLLEKLNKMFFKEGGMLENYPTMPNFFIANSNPNRNRYEYVGSEGNAHIFTTTTPLIYGGKLFDNFNYRLVLDLDNNKMYFSTMSEPLVLQDQATA